MKSLLFQPTIQPEAGLEHRRRLVDVVAVQPHRGFEAQRVARAEAARDDVGRPARLEQRLPHAVGHVRRHEDLEAVLAGVAGARDRGAGAGHFAVREPVVADVAEIDAGQRLQDFARGRPLQRDQRVAAARVDRRGIARRL